MFTYRVSCQNPFRIEGIGKKFFRNGRQQQLESDLSNCLKNYIFESDTFIPSVQPNQTAPSLAILGREFLRNSYFSRGSRDRYNKSLFDPFDLAGQNIRTPSKEEVETWSDTNDRLTFPPEIDS